MPDLQLGASPVRGLISLLSPAGRLAALSVLIFHRVLAHADSLQPDEPDRALFNQQCQWLKDWFNVLPLDEAAERLVRGTLPARALCITFDDGYADNHDVALPVLQAHGLHATFFVSTGYLDGGRMWNDTLIESMRHSPLAVFDASDLGLDGLGVLQLDSMAARRTAAGRLIRACKHLEPVRRLQMVDRVARRAGAALPDDLMMSHGQVRQLALAGMGIGAHTVSHPILAKVDEATALHEMRASKGHLSELCDKEVTMFAYPNGRPGQDYTARDVRLARESGFRLAVSTAPGAARSRSDLLQIPRFTPWDRAPAAFAMRMAKNLFKAVQIA